MILYWSTATCYTMMKCQILVYSFKEHANMWVNGMARIVESKFIFVQICE